MLASERLELGLLSIHEVERDSLTHLRRCQPVALEYVFVERRQPISGCLKSRRRRGSLELCSGCRRRHEYQYRA